MTPLPMPIRIAAGLVATAIEEAQQLPRKLVELPVTAVSQALQTSMRVQQRITELAIKGDRVLSSLYPVPETPSWARFDEDEITEPTQSANGLSDRLDAPDPSAWDSAWDTETPLVSPPRKVSPIQIARDAEQDTAGTETAETADTASGPDGLEEYEQWSLDQLRGRFQSMDLTQLRALLAWETSHQDRPSYVTLLTNRIASITDR
ncbi:MAG: lipid droplet-associated protein [Pseudonocardia sp.]|nr:lipid droplet-associated protein [Pseudonocardia sp.]